MRKKNDRNPQELVDYLTGRRDELRRQLKGITKELAKIEEELQAATYAAGQVKAQEKEVGDGSHSV